jgi:hypothetical protein
MRSLFFILILFPFAAFTQGDMGLADFRDVNQAGYLNPSFIPKADLSIGAPIISSLSFGGSSTEFPIRDFIYPDPDSGQLVIDAKAVYERVSTKANFRLHSDHDWFSLGKKIGEDSYFRFAIRERLNFSGSLPYNLLRLTAEGNAQGLLGEELPFDGLSIDFNWHREFLFGFSTEFGDKLSLGINVKYLQGIASIAKLKTDMNFYTDPNFFDLRLAGDLQYQTTNMSMITADSGISLYSKTPFWANNHGFGIDLGLNFELSEKTSIGLSLVDMGGIRWKNGSTRNATNFDTLSYTGVDLIDLFTEGTGTSNTDVQSFVSDSLTEILDFKEAASSYKTALPFSANVMVSHQMTENSRFYSSLRTMKQASFWLTSILVGYTRRFGENFEIGANYSLTSYSGFNLGLRSSLQIGPVQIFALSDNIVGTFLPQNARYWSTRAGLNLVF